MLQYQNLESAKLLGLRAKMCQCVLCVHMPTYLTCLRAHVSMCLACLHAHVLTCQRALRPLPHTAFVTTRSPPNMLCLFSK